MTLLPVMPYMDGPYEPLPTWCAGDEWCPITAASAIVGKKWHPVLIHRLLLHGPQGFSDLKDRVDGISDKVLSESLKDLEEKNLVEREVKAQRPIRVEYSLTEHGRGLEPVIDALHDWGHEYLTEVEHREESIV